ncbi:MAG TPA: FAD-binding oxidoreductase [Candidatus Limnocylindria bacterium]|nr:FAD-binding oxidoreductase [Candidatus Limnocylindria bacterium]
MTDTLIPGFGGRLIEPTDANYETARLTANATVDARPELIARAEDAADVQAVVRWVRATGRQLAVRSGGHSVAGHSTGDGVVVLDLGLLNDLEIDPSSDAAWAWAGPGVRAGDYTKAAYAVGRATSFGDTGSVGLGGLVPGGGIGWLVRKYGLTIDSLLAAEVVTADGELLSASSSDHADLFWALRGGGGNFGVVTRYKLALQPIGTVLHGMLLMPATRANVRGVIEIGSAAPDDLTLMPYVMAIPPMDEVSASEHGKLGLWVDTLWAGPASAGEPVLAALRALGPLLIDSVVEKPFPDIYRPREEGAERGGWTSSSIFLDDAGDEVLAAVERMMEKAPEGGCLAIIRVLGGAASRVAGDATAFAWRDKRLLVWFIAALRGAQAGPQASHSAWVAEFRAALAERGAGAFGNFMADDSPTAAAAVYPPATLARLRDIKRRYDPDNLFSRNLDLGPA